jgi:hypothetical protein
VQYQRRVSRPWFPFLEAIHDRAAKEVKIGVTADIYTVDFLVRVKNT